MKFYSGLQEQGRPQDNGREAAILHGGKQGKKSESKSKESYDSPHPEIPKALKPAPSQKMTSSMNNSKKQALGNQREGLRNGTRKRKADTSEDRRPARRQRGGPNLQRKRAANLKDEAWLRGRMHVPTTSDYPDVPEQFFKNPKTALHNVVQGLATLDSTFVPLAKEAFQCTLRYDSIKRKEVVESEGRSKVRLLWPF